MRVGEFSIGPGQPLAIIAGPCVAESPQLCQQIGEALSRRCRDAGLTYIFKASFDKANRSSIRSPRGPGLDEGLELLRAVRDHLGLPVTTDIHQPEQAEPVSRIVDLIQIPAFLCRQSDLLAAAAATGTPLNVKKGQFMSPAEMANVITKVLQSRPAAATTGQADPATGRLMLTERGTFFGYHRLVNDFIGLGDLMDLHRPVCFDVTHSTQAPGGAGDRSGGRPDRAPLLARAAVAAGVDALFIETHPQPERALSDAATMLPLDRTLELIDEVAALRSVLKTA